jgi:hypothetical protein
MNLMNLLNLLNPMNLMNLLNPVNLMNPLNLLASAWESASGPRSISWPERRTA